MKHLPLACLVLGASLVAAPAHASPSASPQEAAPLPWSLAYFGELGYHPGLVLGIERPLWESGWHRFFLAGHAGGYTHPRTLHAAFVSGELGYRFSLPFGLSADAAAGVGGQYSVLASETFSPSASGGVERVTDWGRLAFMPSYTLGLGYDLTGLGFSGQRIFAKVQSFSEYPVNTMLVPHLAAIIGVQWNLRRHP